MINKKTKIVCTIGPASWDPTVLEKMIQNGMNCARVNGAFADSNELAKVAETIRSISSEVSLMIDVKGPEIRLNKFAAPLDLATQSEVVIGQKDLDPIFIANYPDTYQFISVGQKIAVGDGDVILKVKKVEDKKIYCEVEVGEMLKPGKALNIPGIKVSREILTEKDISNLKTAIQLGYNFVSASFVQNALAAKQIKEAAGDSSIKLIAKIEDQEGINNIDEILQVVDGIMIARGGLGVELGLEKVPLVQRFLTERAIYFAKPVITATQMLESMTTNPVPTRAEVNDVATAVILGSDAVMLSGETSAGEYPDLAVKQMSDIIISTEHTIKNYNFQISGNKLLDPNMIQLSNNVIENIFKDTSLSMIIIKASDASFSRYLSAKGINIPVYFFTEDHKSALELSLSRGNTRSFYIDNLNTLTEEQKIDEIIKILDLNNLRQRTGLPVLYIDAKHGVIQTLRM